MSSRFRRVHGAIVAALSMVVIALALPASTLASYPQTDLETSYLKLINCTRTGGYVMENGGCEDYGSGKHSAYVAPLKLHHRISAFVSRPMAHRCADAGVLDHTLGGSIHDRMYAAGYGGTIGESMGWSSTPSFAGLVRVHRLMQGEQSYNGWHWRNMKNAAFHSVGIGVWLKDGIWLANDFWSGYVGS
jgi:hypothetical protein